MTKFVFPRLGLLCLTRGRKATICFSIEHKTSARPTTNTHLDNTPDNAGNVRNGTSVAGTEIRAVQHRSRDKDQNASPKRLGNVEECTLCRGEAKTNNNQRDLL